MTSTTNGTSEPAMICFNCGSDQIDIEDDFDPFCSGGPVKTCKYRNCGADWMVDL